jgi:hypothetical protein
MARGGPVEAAASIADNSGIRFISSRLARKGEVFFGGM